MKAKPVGFYVLIKVKAVEEKTKSGIITSTATSRARQEVARDIGEIIAFGPMAFKEGFEECNSPSDWGVKVGDVVEFVPYEGKISAASEGSEYRYIIDKQIVGLTDE